MQEGQRNAGETAFHVAGAATVDSAIDDLATPGVPCPFVLRDRKYIDVSVQHEMAAGVATLESGDDVRHLRVGREDARFQPCIAERLLQERGGGTRVAGRIG